MKILLHYLKRRLPTVGIFAFFALIFAFVFWLYKFPLEAVLYPTVICLISGGIFAIIDFIAVMRRHRALSDTASILNGCVELMPEPVRVEDYDYQLLIRLLTEARQKLETEQNIRYTDMIDYYTVWAHQIKTPISSMRLTLQNEDSQLARQLSADLFRIEQYVEMVLMFLRLGSNSTDYLIRSYELDPIIRQSVKKFAGEFIARKLTLEYEPTNITTISDEKWLAFVIEQVISNALKYTPSGKIRIYAAGEQTLCIEDTGIGIAPEDLPRIFENGYTGINGRSDKRASGIGLHLCREICRRLGHRIYAESEPDRGTRIYIDVRTKKLDIE
ncbi:MAG: HAMP domain-containing histidine kinase [Clostridiales bacterium]|nr:HAMP domain-containing histidine kinase [Clostridiales bacterium]